MNAAPTPYTGRLATVGLVREGTTHHLARGSPTPRQSRPRRLGSAPATTAM